MGRVIESGEAVGDVLDHGRRARFVDYCGGDHGVYAQYSGHFSVREAMAVDTVGSEEHAGSLLLALGRSPPDLDPYVGVKNAYELTARHVEGARGSISKFPAAHGADDSSE